MTGLIRAIVVKMLLLIAILLVIEQGAFIPDMYNKSAIPAQNDKCRQWLIDIFEWICEEEIAFVSHSIFLNNQPQNPGSDTEEDIPLENKLISDPVAELQFRVPVSVNSYKPDREMGLPEPIVAVTTPPPEVS